MEAYVMLDLKAFVNNRGCTPLDAKHLGALSIGGASFPSEEFPFGKPLLIDSIPFQFSQTETSDNMECVEQTISFPPCLLKRLYVLGASSNTDLFDTLCFLHKGTVVYQSRLYLSSFSSSQPAFTDRVALTLDYIHTRMGRYDHIKPHLWYSSLTLSQAQLVDSLQFEDNPSMHVFALTIEPE